MAEGMESIGQRAEQRADVAAARARLMAEDASAYLAELDTAATLMLQRREEAELADRGKWLMRPQGSERTLSGSVLSPLRHMDAYRLTRLQQAAAAAGLDVARIGWWYATAALTALAEVAAGREVTAGQLEMATIRRSGRIIETRDVTSPASAVFRPQLPQQLPSTGREDLDDQAAATLERTREAYAAAELAGDLADRPRLEYCEAADMHDALSHAAAVPELLIDLARVGAQATHQIDLDKGNA